LPPSPAILAIPKSEVQILIPAIRTHNDSAPIKMGESVKKIEGAVVLGGGVVITEKTRVELPVSLLKEPELVPPHKVETTKEIIERTKEPVPQVSSEKKQSTTIREMHIDIPHWIIPKKDTPETGQKESVIREIRENNKITIGIAKDFSKVQFDTNDINEKTIEIDKAQDFDPVTTTAQLSEVINYINILTLEMEANAGLSTEYNSEDNTKEDQDIEVITTDEMLDFILLFSEDTDPSFDENLDSEEIIHGSSITFVTVGETPKHTTIRKDQLSNMQEMLTLLSGTTFENITAQIPPEEKDKTIKSENNNGEIILAMHTTQSQDEGRGNFTSETIPITLVAQLAESVAIVDKIILENRISNALDQDFEVQTGDKASHFTILASEEILTFIEAGNNILATKNPASEIYIKIASTEREILVDLVTLKKVIMLVEMKKKMDESALPKEYTTSPEELDIHTIQGQNLQFNAAFWFIFQTLLHLLATSRDEDLSLFDLFGPQFISPKNFHA